MELLVTLATLTQAAWSEDCPLASTASAPVSPVPLCLGAPPYLGVQEVAAANLPLPRGHLVGGVVIRGPMGYDTIMHKATDGVFADSKTKSNIVKAIRALKLYILKQSANTTSAFLGAGMKTVSMVFILKRFPSSLQALRISLPHNLGHPCEGLFVKTAQGKRVLSVQFGRGDMGEETLTQNAVSVANAVSEKLDTRLVREIKVAVDRLELPVFSKKLCDRGRHQLFKQPPRRRDAKRTSMAPPAAPPPKRPRIISYNPVLAVQEPDG